MPAFAAKNGDLDTMPFGEHKGNPIDTVDTGYLRWWLKKMDSDGLRAEYRESVRAVLEARGDRLPEPRAPDKSTNGIGSARLLFAAETRQMLKAWYGRMTMKFHPDKGGTDESQRVVNECYQALMEELAKWEVKRS
jgi:hypothetical protein